MGIFNTISAQVNIPAITDWIKDLNQSAMFGLFRRDFMSKARNLLGMIVHENIAEKTNLRNSKFTNARPLPHFKMN